MDPNLDLLGVSIPARELVLTGKTPRRTCASANGSKLIKVAMLLLAFAIASVLWFGIGAIRQIQHRAALRGSSLEAVGEITHLGVRRQVSDNQGQLHLYSKRNDLHR